jgi:seryl-tRNA synthetase
VSGSKFYYLRGAAALLELALINWAYSRVGARGFTMLATPDLVRMDVLEKCGFQPRMENTQVGRPGPGNRGKAKGGVKIQGSRLMRL